MAYYTEPQLKRARHTNMYEYMLSQGEPFVKMSQNEYAHAEHDSLRANPKTGVVTWYSHNQLSSFDNAIDFATEYYNKPYEETVNQLLNFKTKKVKQAVKSTKEKFSLEMLSKNHNFDTKQLSKKGRSFLVNERFLDGKLIDQLAKKGLISSDNKENIIFKWTNPKDINQIIGADIQGTYRQPISNRLNQSTGKLGRPYYKGIASNSSATGGFRIPAFRDLQKPLRLYVTEAPIEAISLLEHNLKYGEPERAFYFSQSGLKYESMKREIEALSPYVKDNEHLELVFAVNNDIHGQSYVKDSLKQLKEDDLTIHPFLQMPGLVDGDWNETLELEKTGQLKSRKVKAAEKMQAQGMLQNKELQVETQNTFNSLVPRPKTRQQTTKKIEEYQVEVPQ